MSLGPVRPIVVDDSNAGILYRGAWQAVSTDPHKVDPNLLPFLSTQHRTQTDGSVSYTFRGSSITMFGSVTLPQTTSSTRQAAPWSCSIDNAPVVTQYPTTINGINWPLCHAENLNDAFPHTLTMNVVGSQFSDLAVDQIQYVPPPSTPVQHSSVRLAYNDPLIKYEGKWEVIPDFPGVSTGQTAAEMHMSFYGSSITWMASTMDRGSKALSIATYSLDGGAPVRFYTTSPNPASHLANQTIFRLEGLSNQAHNLFVNFNGTDASTRLFLDYLFIENATINSTIAGSSTAISTFPTMTLTAGGSSDPGNHGSAPSHGGHSNLGAIVGGVVGGVVAIALLTFFLFYLRRKKLLRRVSRTSSGNRAWADRFSFPNDNKAARPFQLGDIPSPTSPSHPRLGFEEAKRSPTSPTTPKYPFTSHHATATENSNPFEDFSPVDRTDQK